MWRNYVVNTTQGEWKSRVVTMGTFLEVWTCTLAMYIGATWKEQRWVSHPLFAILDGGNFSLLRYRGGKVVSSSSPIVEFPTRK